MAGCPPDGAPRRAIVIVLDSVGIGELPDAAAYGDQGSNTLGNIARVHPLRLPTLRRLGLDRLVDLGPPAPAGRPKRPRPDGRVVARKGLGHRSLGIDGDRPRSPVSDVSRRLSAEIIASSNAASAARTLGNVVASGTEIIDGFGPEHLRTGLPIVYTSADSVFQIAAHEEVVPVEDLYRMCEIAFELVVVGLGVGRVIARPFIGGPGSFSARPTGTTTRCRR